MSNTSDDIATNHVPLDYDMILFKIGALLSSSYELIQNILRRLGYQDLINAVQVCQAWSTIGNTILQKQRRLRFITLYPKRLPNTDTHSPEFFVPPQSEALDKLLQESTQDIQACIGFVSVFWHQRKDIVTRFSPNGARLDGLLKNAFPKCSNFALANSYGVIGTVENSQLQEQPSATKRTLDEEENTCLASNHNADGGHTSCSNGSQAKTLFHSAHNFNDVGYTIELEEEIYSTPEHSEDIEALSLVLFPKQPGVQIKVFEIKELEFKKAYRSNVETRKPFRLSEEEFNSQCGLAPEEELKAFLLFTNIMNPFTRAFMEAAHTRQNGNVALGGGLKIHEDPFVDIIGVAITGSNVRSASVVIPSTVMNEVGLQKHLQKLKDCGLPEENSLCFMFSCCGRGAKWYKKGRGFVRGPTNVETKAFRKLFPVTPVFGFFAEGEMGNNFLTEEKDDDLKGNARKKKKKKITLVHQYSSVFVLISFL